MSLAAVKKKVQGVVGRDAPTGQTLFKSWDSLENAMSLIWKNARDYNEDGSEIHNVSLELEVSIHNHQVSKYTNTVRNSSTNASQKPKPRSRSHRSRNSG